MRPRYRSAFAAPSGFVAAVTPSNPDASQSVAPKPSTSSRASAPRSEPKPVRKAA